jgi:hypothetical protein
LAAGVLVLADTQSFADFGIGVAAGEQAEAVVGLGEGCVAAAGGHVNMVVVGQGLNGVTYSMLYVYSSPSA